MFVLISRRGLMKFEHLFEPRPERVFIEKSYYNVGYAYGL